MVFRRRAESARRLLSQTHRNVHIAPLVRTKKWEGPTRPPAGSRRARWVPAPAEPAADAGAVGMGLDFTAQRGRGHRQIPNQAYCCCGKAAQVTSSDIRDLGAGGLRGAHLVAGALGAAGCLGHQGLKSLLTADLPPAQLPVCVLIPGHSPRASAIWSACALCT